LTGDFSSTIKFRTTGELLSEKKSSGQTTRRAGRRERHGFAMVSGDRPGVA
jgi:hypothetical protein